MLKLKRILLTGATLSFLIAFPVFGETKAVSNGSSVNIRESASSDAAAIGQIDSNQNVTVLGSDSSFVKIKYGESVGFVSKEFISFQSADGKINGNSVNIRGNGGATVVGQLNDGDNVTLTGRAGDLLLIEHNGDTALVHRNFVDSEFKDNLKEITLEAPVATTTYAVVTSDTSLNLRSEPSKTAAVAAKIPSGDVLDVLDKDNEWVKVQTSNKQTGYVNSEFVALKTGEKPEKPKASSKGAEVVSYAKQFLGTPYVYGGTSLSNGVDCSGFVYSVYKNFGITLNRTSRSMPANGVSVSKNELVAGDLLFFTNGGAGNIQHVGIYCGDGNFVHAASGKAMRVIVSGLNESYYVNNYISAARVLN